MSARFQCPLCGESREWPDERFGQAVACPACGREMQLPVPGTAEGPAVGRTVPCPRCGEPIAEGARKCMHCRAMLLGPTVEMRFGHRRRKTRASGEGKWALLFGILSLTLCAAPVFMPMAVLYGNSARRNPAERTSGIIGMGLGIGSLAALLLLLVFGVLRLIFRRMA